MMFIADHGSRAGRPEIRFLLAAGLVLGVCGTQSPAFAQTAAATDFPFVILCEYKEIVNAYYFSQLEPDGTAVYITPDRQVGRISINGVAEVVDGDRPGTCQDKTLADLRDSGQAFDLQR